MHPELATERDVVFHFLSAQELLYMAAVLELVVAWMCLSLKVPRFVAWLSLFWLSTCFLFYRLGPLIVMGRAKLECKCLGTLSLAAGQHILDIFLVTVLGLLLVGSAFFAFGEVNAKKFSS